MNHGDATYEPWPRWWRVFLVTICTLILCSCRGPQQRCEPSNGMGAAPPCPAPPQQALLGRPAVGPIAAPFSSYPTPSCPAPCPADPAQFAGGVAPRACPAGPWSPPGLQNDPWPRGEYLLDGGDAQPRVRVDDDWQIHGLNLEDTVGHYDTVDGQTVVAPSNRVCLYSPRFGAVRQVVSLQANEQWDPWAGVHQPVALARHDELQIAATSKQQMQPEGQIGRSLPGLFHAKQGDGAMSTMNGPITNLDKILPEEAPAYLAQGILDGTEMAWLANSIEAARVWSHDHAVQVILDRTRATEEVTDQQVVSVFTVKDGPSRPKLRVIKAASTQFARPGDTVDFTLHFDNVGNEPIGNVTLVDNLTTRLEYVPDTAECSVPAEFLTEPNEGDSLVLRWEITNPLAAGEGGIIRFRCRVR